MTGWFKRKKLEKLFASKEPVKVTDFQVQNAYLGGGNLEVVVSKHQIRSLMYAPSLATCTDRVKEITLDEIQDQLLLQKVAVSVKIVQVDEISSIHNGRHLQTVHIADNTGISKLHLWQDYVNSLNTGKPYKIKNSKE